MRFFIFFSVLFLCACHNSTLQSTSADSTTAKKTPGFEVKQLSGVFYDTLPCADCPGIATRIYLKPDNSFIMEQAYVGKNIVYDMGKWYTTDSILKLTSTEGPRQFKIISYAEIKLLDNEGRMINDTAARLSLRRNNVPFKPLQPVPVEGLFRATGDTMNIHICVLGKDYPVALAPGAVSLPAAYSKAATQKNQPVFVKLAGHFELRPALNDTTTQDFFVVENFIRFIPGQACK